MILKFSNWRCRITRFELSIRQNQPFIVTDAIWLDATGAGKYLLLPLRIKGVHIQNEEKNCIQCRASQIYDSQMHLISASEKGRSTERKCSFLISLYVGKSSWQHGKVWYHTKRFEQHTSTIQYREPKFTTRQVRLTHDLLLMQVSTYSGCMQEKPMIYHTKRTLKLKGMNFQELLSAHNAMQTTPWQ